MRCAMKKILVAPSTDPCDIKDLAIYVKELEKQGADWIHCDIMDGKFVKNRTYDHLVFAFLRKATSLPLDVHLMVENPMDVVDNYVKYGANIITVHYEAFHDIIELINALQEIRRKGVKVGISIKPQTQVEKLSHLINYVDLVLIMSVEPGASGQTFQKESLIKIAYLNKKRAELGLDFLIEVDGGVNTINAPIIAVSGADVLVSGSAIFNSNDRRQTMQILRGKEAE